MKRLFALGVVASVIILCMSFASAENRDSQTDLLIEQLNAFFDDHQYEMAVANIHSDIADMQKAGRKQITEQLGNISKIGERQELDGEMLLKQGLLYLSIGEFDKAVDSLEKSYVALPFNKKWGALTALKTTLTNEHLLLPDDRDTSKEKLLIDQRIIDDYEGVISGFTLEHAWTDTEVIMTEYYLKSIVALMCEEAITSKNLNALNELSKKIENHVGKWPKSVSNPDYYLLQGIYYQAVYYEQAGKHQQALALAQKYRDTETNMIKQFGYEISVTMDLAKMKIDIAYLLGDDDKVEQEIKNFNKEHYGADTIFQW